MNLSVIVPIFNERKYIESCLNSIIDALNEIDSYELLLCDGGSTDGTLEVLNEYAKRYSFIRIMDNPHRVQVHALNIMLDVCCGEYVVRCDAHSSYPNRYFSILVNALKNDGGIGNIGLPTETLPGDDSNKSIAISINLNSKFGVGISHRTTSLKLGEIVNVDTVLFGAWRRSVFDKVGLFDENYIRGQDYEHNIRIRKSGFRISQICSDEVVKYYTRNEYRKLFNMMKQYASVKPLIMRDHKIIPNFRSLIPFGFYLTMLIFIVFGFLNFGLILALTYLFSAFFFSAYECFKRALPVKMCFLVFFGYLVQHAGHAFGMLVGLKNIIFRKGTINWGGTR